MSLSKLNSSRRAGSTQSSLRRSWAVGSLLALSFGVASLPREAAGYRTASDLEEFEGQRVAWSDPRVEFELNGSSLPEGLVLSEVVDAFEAALSEWSSPECTVVDPVATGTTEARAKPMDGRNTVVWVDDWSDRGFEPSAAATTDVQYLSEDGHWKIGEADIYLNAESFSWSIGEQGDARDVSAVLVHELGHALGLLHQCEFESSDPGPACEAGSPYEGATMYPIYDEDQSTLATDDVEGICFLYGEASDCGDCGSDRFCLDGQCVLPCPGAICGPGEICGDRGCVAEGSCTKVDCAGDPCDHDAECGPLSVCRDQRCSRGDQALGSPCSKSPDCSEGVCVSGSCEPECFAEGECGNAGECVDAEEGGVRGCIDSGLYPFGAECARGEDCSSGICALTDERHLCTERCSEDSECVSGYECAPVDGKNVCVPIVAKPAGGCSVAACMKPIGASGWVVLLSFVSVLGRQRQRLRRDR